MRGSAAVLVTVVIGLGAGVARAARDLAPPLEDVTVVNDGEGSARILFRVPSIPFSERTVIQHASLRIPYVGESENEWLDLRICPVTETWGDVGEWHTEFDGDLYAPARADLSRGSGAVVFDLTVLLKENLEEGVFSDGFVLTTGSQERAGIDESQVERFAFLVGAEFNVTTTTVPTVRTPPDR
ncbi:MAG TPA: hypothetical protein VFR10_01610 [bacterium]|nr:hypothetical protein [bacterium]